MMRWMLRPDINPSDLIGIFDNEKFFELVDFPEPSPEPEMRKSGDMADLTDQQRFGIFLSLAAALYKGSVEEALRAASEFYEKGYVDFLCAAEAVFLRQKAAQAGRILASLPAPLPVANLNPLPQTVHDRLRSIADAMKNGDDNPRSKTGYISNYLISVWCPTCGHFVDVFSPTATIDKDVECPKCQSTFFPHNQHPSVGHAR